jgi:hypothetical protein
VAARIEHLLEELVDDVKVILESRRGDLAKLFDENVEKGTDERKRI